MKIEVSISINGAALIPTPLQISAIEHFIADVVLEPRSKEAKPLEVVPKSGKLKHTSKKGIPRKTWSIAQMELLVSRYQELRDQGVKQGKAFIQLSQEVGHSPYSCQLKIYSLKRKPLVPNPKPNENPSSPVGEPLAVTAGRKDDDDNFEFPDEQV